jgi:hypothetical protein
MKRIARDLAVYETTGGVKLHLQPVSNLLIAEIAQVVERQFRATGEPIDPPTYTVQTVGGGEQTFYHDETTLDYPPELALRETGGDVQRAEELAAQRTRQTRAAWQAHRDAVERMQRETQRRQGNLLLEDGVVGDKSGECWDGTVPQDWIERQRRRGFELPDDPLELRTFYILRGLLVTPQDQQEVIYRIMALSAQGVDDDLVDAALSFFRNKVAGQDAAGEVATRGNRLMADEQ